MNNAGSSRIIDLREWTDITTSILDCCLRELFAVAELDPRLWSFEYAQQWVRLRLDDTINGRLMWAQNSAAADAFLKDHFFEVFPAEVRNERMDDLFVALDPMEIMIGELVDDILQENPWTICHTTYRYDYVFIEMGQDYRIQTFEEKVRTGEWSY